MEIKGSKSVLISYHKITHPLSPDHTPISTQSLPSFPNRPFRVFSEHLVRIFFLLGPPHPSPNHLSAHLSVQVAVFILGQGLPIQQQLPPGGLVQVLQQGSHRALPRAIGPHQCCHLARTQGERQPLGARGSTTQ